MDSFMKDLLSFVGQRVTVAYKTIRNRLDMPDVSALPDEEAANVREPVNGDAIYLQGLGDGLRLAGLLFHRRYGDV